MTAENKKDHLPKHLLQTHGTGDVNYCKLPSSKYLHLKAIDTPSEKKTIPEPNDFHFFPVHISFFAIFQLNTRITEVQEFTKMPEK